MKLLYLQVVHEGSERRIAYLLPPSPVAWEKKADVSVPVCKVPEKGCLYSQSHSPAVMKNNVALDWAVICTVPSLSCDKSNTVALRRVVFLLTSPVDADWAPFLSRSEEPYSS
jgi:hypothetical protein